MNVSSEELVSKKIFHIQLAYHYLEAWFDGLASGGVTSISFTSTGVDGGGDYDAPPPSGGFDAPDFIVGTVGLLQDVQLLNPVGP